MESNVTLKACPFPAAFSDLQGQPPGYVMLVGTVSWGEGEEDGAIEE